MTKPDSLGDGGAATVQNVSYWQRGHNDGYAGKPEVWPSKNGPHDRQNYGYMNGYYVGRGKRFAEGGKDRLQRIAAGLAADPKGAKS